MHQPPPPHVPNQADTVLMMSVPIELVPAVERMIAAHRSDVRPSTGPLEYHAPEPPRPRPLADWSLMLALFGLCGVLHVMAAAVVPHYEAIYRDFGTKLPTSTIGIVQFSRFVTADLGWAYFWPLAVVIPILVAQFGPRLRRRCGGLGLGGVLVLLIAVALLLFSHFALVAPIERTLSVVVGGGGGVGSGR